jgi:thiamine biosynthesis lipoprotein
LLTVLFALLCTKFERCIVKPVVNQRLYPVKWLFYILLTIFVFPVAGTAQVLQDASVAFTQARRTQQPVLLIFSGSDWCQPCIRLQHTILSDTGFLHFARKSLVLLEADFPQRKKLPDSVVTQNENLAEQYNPDGAFPNLVLLKPDGSLITTVAYNNQTPGTFVQQISQLLRNANMMKEFTRHTKLMGSAFEFIVVAGNNGEALLNESIGEVQRIEALLTEFSPHSETSRINQQAGLTPVTVSDETWQLIKRSMDISALTHGAFDITAGALKKLYNFRGEHFSLPDNTTIQQTLARTGYQKIQLTTPSTVWLPVKGMHIGFAAIGKGYAADKVKWLLQEKGVESGVINASGDLTAWGLRANGEPWKTGIAHPDEPDRILVWLPVNGMSVATSGNYIQYFDVNGTRYSHNIDPATGYPVKGIKSVTVISPAAALSDALATAVTVMGVTAGLHFIDQLPQTHAIIVDEANKIYSSKHINIEHAI